MSSSEHLFVRSYNSWHDAESLVWNRESGAYSMRHNRHADFWNDRMTTCSVAYESGKVVNEGCAGFGRSNSLQQIEHLPKIRWIQDEHNYIVSKLKILKCFIHTSSNIILLHNFHIILYFSCSCFIPSHVSYLLHDAQSREWIDWVSPDLNQCIRYSVWRQFILWRLDLFTLRNLTYLIKLFSLELKMRSFLGTVSTAELSLTLKKEIYLTMKRVVYTSTSMKKCCVYSWRKWIPT